MLRLLVITTWRETHIATMFGSHTCHGCRAMMPPESEEDFLGLSDEGMFRASCVMTFKDFLQECKGMTAAAAKDFISERVKISVINVTYDDSDSVRSATVRSKISAARKASGSEVAAINLKYEYHHRVRFYSIEHFCKLKYSMSGTSGSLFKTRMADLPGRGERQIEKRSFTFSHDEANMLRDSVFGDGWTPLEAVLACYAATGVVYGDDGVCLPSHAHTPVCKGDWLEHYTRKACKATTEEDDGYETEPFHERYQAELEEMRADRQGSDDDDDDDHDDDDDVRMYGAFM